MTAGLSSTPARVVLVDKPKGWTSFDVVRYVRRNLGGRSAKVGHSGTLDPFATGLLLVLTGQATRISLLLTDLPKEYVVTAQFGAISSTQDCTGEIRPCGGTVTEEQIGSALPSLRGSIVQRVPLTSAIKVDGEALYRRAHRGETMETPEREVVVHDLKLLSFDPDSQRAELRAHTSKGTYVRTLVHDLGHMVGSGAYALELRRTAIGDFRVESAVAPEACEPGRLETPGGPVLTVAQALAHLPRAIVDSVEAGRASHGNLLQGLADGLSLVVAEQGLLAIYESREGTARPLVVFPTPL